MFEEQLMEIRKYTLASVMCWNHDKGYQKAGDETVRTRALSIESKR